MTQTHKIRIMTIDDYESVFMLWTRTPGMGLNTTEDSRDGIARYLARNPNTCFVAEEAGDIVGVILSGHDGRRGFIHHAAVSSACRNKGIGSALLERVMQALEAEGIHKVALVVYESNHTGNSFWEKHGFHARNDLIYRNKNITELTLIQT